MTSPQEWLHGARPRTLPLAVAPILGAAAVVAPHERNVLVLVLCAAVALALQIGVNYANDYSDGIRGTDARRAVTGGPVRLVGQGLASPRAVKRAALLSFAAACACGLAVVAVAGDWRLLFIGAAAVPAAWFYTGGSRPYGYAGLGEVFVFIFFGLAAVLGTVFAISGTITTSALWAATGEGLLAAAVLMVNNIRDIATDAPQGKRTLAVRLGDRRGRLAYVVMTAVGMLAIVLAVSSTLPTVAITVLVATAAGWTLTLGRRALSNAYGPALVPVLASTSRGALAVSALALALAVVTGS